MNIRESLSPRRRALKKFIKLGSGEVKDPGPPFKNDEFGQHGLQALAQMFPKHPPPKDFKVRRRTSKMKTVGITTSTGASEAMQQTEEPKKNSTALKENIAKPTRELSKRAQITTKLPSSNIIHFSSK